MVSNAQVINCMNILFFILSILALLHAYFKTKMKIILRRIFEQNNFFVSKMKNFIFLEKTRDMYEKSLEVKIVPIFEIYKMMLFNNILSRAVLIYTLTWLVKILSSNDGEKFIL